MTELYQVRNPWLRRSVVIVSVPIFLPLLLLVAVCEAAASEVKQEWRDSVWSIKRAWKGA